MSKTVTKALKETFNELNLSFPKKIYSDSRRGRTAVGVKLVGEEISEEDMLLIERRMSSKGFKFLSKKMNKGGHYATRGTRLTFENYSEGLAHENEKLIRAKLKLPNEDFVEDFDTKEDEYAPCKHSFMDINNDGLEQCRYCGIR